MSPSLNGTQEFVDLFQQILTVKLKQQELQFDDASPEHLQERLRHVVKLTYQSYISLHGANFRDPAAEMSSITGSTTMLSSTTGDFHTPQQSLSDDGTHQYALAPDMLYPDTSLQPPSYDGYTGDSTAAMASGSGTSYMDGMPVTEASLMQNLSYGPTQPLPGQALPAQQPSGSLHSPHMYHAAEASQYAPQAPEGSHARHSQRAKPMGPPSQNSSRGSRSKRSSKKNSSHSERRILPPLQPTPQPGSSRQVDLVSSPSNHVPLTPTALQMNMMTSGSHESPYASSIPQEASPAHGQAGQQGHYGQYGHSAGPSMTGTNMGTHLVSPRYAQYGQHEASDFYNKVPWQVAGTSQSSQGHTGMSLPPIETRPYDNTMASGSQQPPTGTGYYGPYGTYEGSHSGDYRSHP